MGTRGYAALWDDGGTPLAGRIDLGPKALVFEGSGPGRQASRQVLYERIASLALSRSPDDRIAGRTALVLTVTGGEVIRVATPELGALHELAELIKAKGDPS